MHRYINIIDHHVDDLVPTYVVLSPPIESFLSWFKYFIVLLITGSICAGKMHRHDASEKQFVFVNEYIILLNIFISYL